MKNSLSSSKGSCIRNFESFSPILPHPLEVCYDPTETTLAILYAVVPHMLPAKYQPNPPSGSGEEDFRFLNGFYHIWAWRPS